VCPFRRAWQSPLALRPSDTFGAAQPRPGETSWPFQDGRPARPLNRLSVRSHPWITDLDPSIHHLFHDDRGPVSPARRGSPDSRGRENGTYRFTEKGSISRRFRRTRAVIRIRLCSMQLFATQEIIEKTRPPTRGPGTARENDARS
jgi:hypothetical protein